MLFFLASLFVASLCSDVIVLNSENFQSTIDDNKFILVEFYAPWCGHCKNLEPHYEEAATILKGEIALAKVDCTVEEELAQENGIQGFPTLKFYVDGEAREYGGPREAAGIVSWLRKKSQPPSTQLQTQEEAAEFMSKNEIFIIGSFTDRESAEYVNFLKVAGKEEFDAFLFADIVDSDLAKANGIETPGVLVSRKGEVATDDIDADFNLLDFVNEHAFPLVDELGRDSYMRLMKEEKPLAIFVYARDPSNKNDEVKAMVDAVAEKFKGQFWFLVGDSSEFGAIVERMGASGTVFPSVIGFKPTEGRTKQVVFDEDTEVTAESLTSWVEAVLDGTAVSWKKSQPVPENDGPLTVVVGSTFESIVYDETKDVLIEFYAPWCGHCKSLAPTYLKLAEAFADIDSVVVANFDATANSYPENLEIQGFPTIMLFPAGSTQGIEFQGARSLAGLGSFIQENAKTEFTHLEFEEEEEEDSEWEDDEEELEQEEEDDEDEDEDDEEDDEGQVVEDDEDDEDEEEDEHDEL